MLRSSPGTTLLAAFLALSSLVAVAGAGGPGGVVASGGAPAVAGAGGPGGVIASGGAPAVAVASPRQGDSYAAVDACVARAMADKGVRGASLAIAMGGELVHARAFGVKDEATGEAVDTDTMFRINSTTKMMTAAAVLQLVEAGSLDLHAPITAVAPGFRVRPPWSAADITLHTLLSNTAAVPDPYLDYAGFPLSFDQPAFGLDLRSWASRLSAMHLYAPPGSFWNYSSPNFSLAALAVEAVTGMTYSDYVTQRLWRPAGMKVTTFESADFVPGGNYATGYYRGAPRAPGYYDRIYARPAGGAYSTATELVTWALTLDDGGDILAPSSVAAMTTPHVSMQAVPWSPVSSYGYGIFIDPYRPRADPAGAEVAVLRHPGNGRGYSTELAWVPELGFVVATLINDVASFSDVVDCALAQVAGLAPARRSNLKTPISTWGKYAGTYALTDVYGDHWTARVTQDPGGLGISYPDWALAPTIAAKVPDAAMTQLFLDTFSYAGYGGKTIVSFVDDPADPARARWMRNQYFVAQRVGELPAAVDIQGAGCSKARFTLGLDAPALTVRARGLSKVLSLRRHAIAQDDPDDPASASIRLDLDTTGDLGFLTAWLFEDSDDNIEMYLLQDTDGDGEYTWPEELVDRLAHPKAQGLIVAERNTASGPYQLWLHGQRVRGTASAFDLDVVAISGDELAVVGAPASAAAGDEVAFEVCASPTAADTGPRVGVVDLDLGLPGSMVRLPVYWRPSDRLPPPRLFLPALAAPGP